MYGFAHLLHIRLAGVRAEGDLRVERPALAAAPGRVAEPVDPQHAERVLHAGGRRIRHSLVAEAAAV